MEYDSTKDLVYEGYFRVTYARKIIIKTWAIHKDNNKS